ncbi:MAG: Transcription elongation factor GreA [Candidatus Levybacteria bacterium GW2011_GWB1_39_7]|nr:MAG: Transcription elongation factor GreA [Candidatus Levybacteria bacterium GW2011_GWA1_39_11]KKR25235.1 MAG: Transcription elongation factor GreA [Candidatus Levybacteria bacterium GW2011_GWB1_39_7]KKR27504.1 MAG: Transcription elongation factor GreA [Microgenomates group bacterium GW2011_GWC1_39_7]OGH45335.1 MAG: hypothetical protein A3H82_01770 [Candidatus Levybacteria bacterium RIFCSPLOWO2_02_FULL_39_26]OGH48406.1 MAG: hypothetical protein A3G66_00315 [Candidatus Levybacteria bacterium 
MRRVKFTKEGFDNLKAEYEKLLKERPEAVGTLKAARELGDLSENSLYHTAKANLRSIDSRLGRLSNMIKLATVVRPKKFTVEQDGKKVVYEIVGDFEANPADKKISANSPIGNALIDKKIGDHVSIKTPKGKITIKILKIH